MKKASKKNARKGLRKWILISLAILLALIAALYFLLVFSAPYPIGSITVVTGKGIEMGNVYLAKTPKQQEGGFMNFSGIGDCNGEGGCVGMLFVFGSEGDRCFWMKNTQIPLKQSWIGANGTVLFVYDAKPGSDLAICYYAQNVLETPPNFTIAPGDTVSYST